MNILELNKDKEEEKRIRAIKDKIYQKAKYVDRLLRETSTNSFEKVYTSLALQKIIEELALQYYPGKIEVEKTQQYIEIQITAPKLTITDVKNILHREQNNNQIYTLLEALKEVDDFKVENNPLGSGIIFKVYQYFQKPAGKSGKEK